MSRQRRKSSPINLVGGPAPRQAPAFTNENVVDLYSDDEDEPVVLPIEQDDELLADLIGQGVADNGTLEQFIKEQKKELAKLKDQAKRQAKEPKDGSRKRKPEEKKEDRRDKRPRPEKKDKDEVEIVEYDKVDETSKHFKERGQKLREIPDQELADILDISLKEFEALAKTPLNPLRSCEDYHPDELYKLAVAKTRKVPKDNKRLTLCNLLNIPLEEPEVVNVYEEEKEDVDNVDEDVDEIVEVSEDSKNQLTKKLFDFPNQHPHNRYRLQTTPELAVSQTAEDPCMNPTGFNLDLQQKRVVRAIQNTRGLILVHQVGSGKTLSAIAIANCYLQKNPNKKVIIVTPASLINNFKKEVRKFLKLNEGQTHPIFTKLCFYTFDGFLTRKDKQRLIDKARRELENRLLSQEQRKPITEQLEKLENIVHQMDSNASLQGLQDLQRDIISKIQSYIDKIDQLADKSWGPKAKENKIKELKDTQKFVAEGNIPNDKFLQDLYRKDLKRIKLLMYPNFNSLSEEYREKVDKAAEKYLKNVKDLKSCDRYADNKKENRDLNCKDHMLIIDEAHNLRTPPKENKETGEKSGIKVEAIYNCARNADKVVLLTATPVYNNPRDMFTLMSFINPNVELQHFLKVHPAIYKSLNWSQPSKFDSKQIEPITGLARIVGCQTSFYDIDEKTKSAYPRSTVFNVYFKMSPKALEAYKDIEKNKIPQSLRQDVYTKGLYDSLKGNSQLNVFYNGVRKASNDIEGQLGPKFLFIRDLLKKQIIDKPEADKGKVVIYSSYLTTGVARIEAICKDLRISYAKIVGKIPKEQRQEIVRQYNKDYFLTVAAATVSNEDRNKPQIRVLIISKAGGEGLDLKGTTDLIMTEPGWNEASAQQVVGRAIRKESHSKHLELEKQHVNVYKLFLVKPQEFSKIVNKYSSAITSREASGSIVCDIGTINSIMKGYNMKGVETNSMVVIDGNEENNIEVTVRSVAPSNADCNRLQINMTAANQCKISPVSLKDRPDATGNVSAEDKGLNLDNERVQSSVDLYLLSLTIQKQEIIDKFLKAVRSVSLESGFCQQPQEDPSLPNNRKVPFWGRVNQIVPIQLD